MNYIVNPMDYRNDKVDISCVIACNCFQEYEFACNCKDEKNKENCPHQCKIRCRDLCGANCLGPTSLKEPSSFNF